MRHAPVRVVSDRVRCWQHTLTRTDGAPVRLDRGSTHPAVDEAVPQIVEPMHCRRSVCTLSCAGSPILRTERILRRPGATPKDFGERGSSRPHDGLHVGRVCLFSPKRGLACASSFSLVKLQRHQAYLPERMPFRRLSDWYRDQS